MKDFADITEQFLDDENACSEGRERWRRAGSPASAVKALKAAVNAGEYGDAAWIISNCVQNHRAAVRLAVFSARLVAPYNVDKRVADALETAERWLGLDASAAWAATAASDAAWAASRAAASDAAWAAARSAAWAASAASCAAASDAACAASRAAAMTAACAAYAASDAKDAANDVSRAAAKAAAWQKIAEFIAEMEQEND